MYQRHHKKVSLQYELKKISILLNHRGSAHSVKSSLGSVHETKPKNSFVHGTEPKKGLEFVAK